MVQKGTYLVPTDRCGVWFTRIFHLYGGFKKKNASISNFVKISVRSTKPNSAKTGCGYFGFRSSDCFSAGSYENYQWPEYFL